ncbi:hypothetical protein JK165_09040 [Acetobacter okinawensis]|uniref:hypothetical protein n=1 Tax=Acetobacter okinawensis TaxID=1076594 RepID=UPI001BABD732|nr:hypothetical protein [Acetobacter okinawensis]MBS0966230.1 hypothetical protein [Acetobacter okinawensis]
MSETKATATAKWWSTSYPSRYYACPNSSALIGGYPSVMWVDVNVFPSAPSWLPAASGMIAMTETEWTARSTVNQIIKDGTVQTYVATTTDTTTTSSTATTTTATDSTTTTSAAS